MRLFKKTIPLTFSSLILLGLISLPVAAGGYSITLGYGGHNNNHSYGHHYPSKHYNHGYSKHNSYRYKQHRYPDYQQRNHNSYNAYGNRSSYTKPCHQTSKIVVDGYGRYQKIGGTMCYNSYGQGYIVSGSRYKIR